MVSPMPTYIGKQLKNDLTTFEKQANGVVGIDCSDECTLIRDNFHMSRHKYSIIIIIAT